MGEEMGIVDQLSSQVGDRTEESNRRVVAQILANPALLAEVAEERPEWVAPHAEALAALLGHKKARVRWEATYALYLVAPLTPELIGSLLPRLGGIIRSDSSVIVRDSVVDAVGNYAATSAEAAQAAYPILKEALIAWEGKHIARVLKGFSNVASVEPGLADELRALGQGYIDDRRGVVRKAAKALVRATQN